MIGEEPAWKREEALALERWLTEHKNEPKQKRHVWHVPDVTLPVGKSNKNKSDDPAKQARTAKGKLRP